MRFQAKKKVCAVHSAYKNYNTASYRRTSVSCICCTDPRSANVDVDVAESISKYMSQYCYLAWSVHHPEVSLFAR